MSALRGPTILVTWALISALPANSAHANDENSVSTDEEEKYVTYVFECPDNRSIVVRSEADSAWVFDPGGTLHLPLVETGLVQTYHDANLWLRIDARSAMFAYPGRTPVNCLNNRRKAIWENAKLNGADFRAVGNEPGWNMEIYQDLKIILSTEYGTSRTEHALHGSTADPVARTTHWTGDDLELMIRVERCVDSMSGEHFESTVELKLGAQVLNGCGKALH